MKKTLLALILGISLFSACVKDNIDQPAEPKVIPCEAQTGNPAGRSYSSDSVIVYACTSKHCGLLPLSTRNYWIYQDSIFADGVFSKVQYDTLRFTNTVQSLADGLVWWQSNIEVGLPDLVYANDSTLFSMADRFFTPNVKDAKKEYGLFPGDSLRYLTSFEDAAAQGRSLKVAGTISTPAGDFDENVYFEKNARNYRKDQVFFKPGIGVLRYVQEKAPLGFRVLKLQQISTLVSYHIE